MREKKKRNDEIQGLYVKGVSVRDIAKIFDIHWTTVHKIVKKRAEKLGISTLLRA